MVQKTLVCVVGARPNFMKMEPIIWQLQTVKHLIKPYLVHKYWDGKAASRIVDEIVRRYFQAG